MWRTSRRSCDGATKAARPPLRRHHRTTRALQSRRRILSYPVTLATVIVDGDAMDMKLPADPLPVPKKLPSVAEMLNRTPDAVRHVAFEICGNKEGVTMQDPELARSQLWLVFYQI